MDSLTFLEQDGAPLPVYVVHGDEDFLKRQVLAAIRRRALEGADPAFALSSYAGDRAIWANVLDELQTLPFLSPRRLVVVENAEPFVTAVRGSLEKYVAAPSKNGVLILEVTSWPSNTRLYKLVGDRAAIGCKTLAGAKLAEWCRQYASEHGKQLVVAASQLLVDLVGTDMGLLSQEIAKLAAYAGEAKRIDSEDVDKLVGNSRAENTFNIFALIGNGKVGEALRFLDRLLGQGEDPMKILGGFGWHLRKLAQAARLSALGRPLLAALADVGFREFRARECEQQLRHLGRRRCDRLFDWLLEIDLGMKGSSQLPPRTLLERLVVRLAIPNPPAPARAR